MTRHYSYNNLYLNNFYYNDNGQHAILLDTPYTNILCRAFLRIMSSLVYMMNMNMNMNNELAVAYPGSLLSTIGSIVWTNAHDCPSGYRWNEDGWIQTKEPYLQVRVNMLPYMLTKLGEEELLYQNMLALRYLNTKGRTELTAVLKYKFRMSYYREPKDVVINNAVSRSYAVNKLIDVLPKLDKDLFGFYDIWYSKECTLNGRKQIQAIIKQEYIEKSRELMSIDTKYNTKCVMEFADVSKYTVDKHWRVIGLDKKGRTARAIGDAIEYLMNEEGKDIFSITQKEVASVAGISVRSLQNHYEERKMLL